MEYIEIKVENGVAVAVMDHNKENRFSGPFLQEIRQMLMDVKKDSSVKSLVVTGAHEKYFSNGLDLDWMMKQGPDDLKKFLLGVSQMLKETALFGKPLIGAINGHAFGLGCIWACGFDFRLMREDRGWACFPEMDINIPFIPGMIALCEHGLGTVTFREMVYSAKRYTGPEAVEVGWAREAAAQDKLISSAVSLASFMGEKKQPAFAVTKKRFAHTVAKIIDELDPDAINESNLGV